jgi:predicted hotdog family 3-hydroxylacyl-ACP dehydratase
LQAVVAVVAHTLMQEMVHLMQQAVAVQAALKTYHHKLFLLPYRSLLAEVAALDFRETLAILAATHL